MMRWATLLVLATLMLGACKKTDDSAAKQTEAESAEPAAPLTDEALDKVDLPVKEDYEEEAYKAINEDNLESQLDELEKEISGDK